MDENRWQLSKTAQERPDLYNAALSVARLELGISPCCGARLGRGITHLQGMRGIVSTVLLWYPVSKPEMYRTMEVPGHQSIDIKGLLRDHAWVAPTNK